MAPGADFLQLDARHVPRGGLTDWLAASIRTAIADGTVRAGARLPATRVLAADLGLSRGTVAEAYRRLAEEGLTLARVGAGTTVATPPHRPAPPPAARQHRSGTAAHSRGAVGTGDHRDVIDLATGLPDLASFPRAAWLRAERDVLATAGQLGYAPAEGTVELREELSAWLARSRGVIAPPDRIVITGGVTGALSLLAQVLRERGVGSVAVENPGAHGNRRILDFWMPELVPVAVDEEGLDTTALRDTGAMAVLVTPAHQYPTGVVLSPARRRSLVAWAAERGALVIEDDYDAEHRYDRAPVRALQPLAPESVAYTASLSKTLAPALRLGWLVPPSHLHAQVVRTRWATDLGSPVLPQLTLAHLLRAGALERHLRTIRGRHRTRRDAAIAALRAELPGCPVRGIAAGVHLLVLLPDVRDDAEVVASARERGVLVQPLSHHRAGPGPQGLVINYAGHRPERLRAAIARLAQAVRDAGA